MSDFVEGNYEDKYNARNPVSKLLMNNFLKSFKNLLSEVNESEIKSVCEIGVGEGNLLKVVAQIFPNVNFWATDLSKKKIKEAENNLKDFKINFSVQNAEKLDIYRDN